MKQQSEQRTEAALKLLLQTLEQNVADTGSVLDEFEASHTEQECEQSKQYRTLAAASFALEALKDRINEELNK